MRFQVASRRPVSHARHGERDDHFSSMRELHASDFRARDTFSPMRSCAGIVVGFSRLARGQTYFVYTVALRLSSVICSEAVSPPAYSSTNGVILTEKSPLWLPKRARDGPPRGVEYRAPIALRLRLRACNSIASRISDVLPKHVLRYYTSLTRCP